MNYAKHINILAKRISNTCENNKNDLAFVVGQMFDILYGIYF